MSTASKLDAQLYPILKTAIGEPRELRDYLLGKLEGILNDIEKAQGEIAQHIRTTAALKPKDGQQIDKIAQVLRNLNGIVDKLLEIQRDYKSLVSDIVGFLDDLVQTKTTIDEYFSRTPAIGEENCEQLLRDLDVLQSNVADGIRRLRSHADRLIEQIHKQEPAGAAEHDAERITALIETLRVFFETQVLRHLEVLREHHDVARLKGEFNDIQKNIEDVRRQLRETQDQFRESATTVNTIALSFDYFEQTIQVTLSSFLCVSNKFRALCGGEPRARS